MTLGKVLEEYGIDVDDIFNMDESGFEPDKNGDYVFGYTGVKAACARGSESQQHVTVGICLNRSKAIPPFIIVMPGKSVPADALEGAPPGTLIIADGKNGSNFMEIMAD